MTRDLLSFFQTYSTSFKNYAKFPVVISGGVAFYSTVTDFAIWWLTTSPLFANGYMVGQ